MIDGAKVLGLPPYGSMFVVVSTVLLGFCAVYAGSDRREKSSEPVTNRDRRAHGLAAISPARD
jgi:hypothetical protein